MYELSSPAHMHYEGSQEILLSSMLPFFVEFYHPSSLRGHFTPFYSFVKKYSTLAVFNIKKYVRKGCGSWWEVGKSG